MWSALIWTSSPKASTTTNSGTPVRPTTSPRNWRIADQRRFAKPRSRIDGQPAGVASVYPWIYTGGIDPYLWRPIPGVHTLNFEPYRVDLTPFAGVLSNGQQHTVAVSVYNADQYFSATATLLLYQDDGSTQVTGAVTENTIGQPNPNIIENISTNGTISYGTLSVTSTRGTTLEGYVNTSHGRVDTKIVQSIDFSNAQKYYVVLDGSVYDQYVGQMTGISSVTTTQDSGNVLTNSKQYSWPLNLSYGFTGFPDGSYQQYTRSAGVPQERTGEAEWHCRFTPAPSLTQWHRKIC